MEKTNNNQYLFAASLFISLFTPLTAEQTTIIQPTPSSATAQIPSFDYKNMTKTDILKLSPEQLLTIDEKAFSQIFDSAQTQKLSNITNQTTQTSGNTTEQIGGGGGTKSKITELISLQKNMNQKIANQNIAINRLQVLYKEDLLLHKKINFTQGKIIQIEKLK